MNGLRLLPWSSPEGKPCFLSTDDDNSRLSRKADEIEALQLDMGTQLLGHASALLDDEKAGKQRGTALPGLPVERGTDRRAADCREQGRTAPRTRSTGDRRAG